MKAGEVHIHVRSNPYAPPSAREVVILRAAVEASLPSTRTERVARGKAATSASAARHRFESALIWTMRNTARTCRTSACSSPFSVKHPSKPSLAYEAVTFGSDV